MIVKSAEFVKGIRGTDPVTHNGIPQVAFIGRSNVGKSSLVAALTGKKKLVKVSDTPGKTREINFFLINKKTYLVDLPGYGYASVNPKEKDKLKKLIYWYLVDSGVQPEQILVILDAKVGVTKFDEETLELLREQQHPFTVVVNKVDKLTQKELAAQLKTIRAATLGAEVIMVSATAGDGIKKLSETLFA